jgi:hypothetical protein
MSPSTSARLHGVISRNASHKISYKMCVDLPDLKYNHTALSLGLISVRSFIRTSSVSKLHTSSLYF